MEDFDPYEMLTAHSEVIDAHTYNFTQLEAVINNHSEHIDINTERTTALHSMINDLFIQIAELEKQVKELTHD